MGNEKCKVNGIHFTPCEVLSKAIDGSSPSSKKKGLFLPMRINVKTGQQGHDILQIHSGKYVGNGVAANFCPFCGESIVTWGEK